MLWAGSKAAEYGVLNIVTMSLYLSHFQKNNHCGSKIKRNILLYGLNNSGKILPSHNWKSNTQNNNQRRSKK